MRTLVEAVQAEPFEPMAGRPMNGWVVVGPGGDQAAPADEARAYVESLQRQRRAQTQIRE